MSYLSHLLGLDRHPDVLHALNQAGQAAGTAYAQRQGVPDILIQAATGGGHDGGAAPDGRALTSLLFQSADYEINKIAALLPGVPDAERPLVVLLLSTNIKAGLAHVLAQFGLSAGVDDSAIVTETPKSLSVGTGGVAIPLAASNASPGHSGAADGHSDGEGAQTFAQ